MKTYYAVLFMGCTFVSAAQTLTQSSHAPSAGELFSTLRCDSQNVLPGNAGANMLWDFSAVQIKNYGTGYTVCPAASSHSPASVGICSALDTVSYFRSGVSALEYFGGNIQVSHWLAALNYTSPAVFAVYPMSLNTSTTSVIGGSISIIQFPGTFTGLCHVVADGSGTLVLPGNGASYPGTLRVVTTQTVDFSAHTAPGSFITTTYDYYWPAIKAPLFSITVTSSTISGGVPPVDTRTVVNIHKDYLLQVGIEDRQKDESVEVYPNPSDGLVHFTNAVSGARSLDIYNSGGHLVASHEIERENFSLDVSVYRPGLYFYRLKGVRNEILKTGRILVRS